METFNRSLENLWELTQYLCCSVGVVRIIYLTISDSAVANHVKLLHAESLLRLGN